MSTHGFTPPPDEEEALSTDEVEGEPDTIEDEFAKDDAPEQEFEEDA